MKSLFTITIITLFFSSFGYSQAGSKATIFTKAEHGQTKTINLNIGDYDTNVISQLKEDLLQYHEKISFLSLNETLQTLTFTYTEFMLIEDLIRVFYRNNVSPHLKSSTPPLTNNPTK